MKFLVPAAISAFALLAPVFAADLQDRARHRYQQQHNVANTVTVHDTVVSTKIVTQFATVTVGADQAQCTQDAQAVESTSAQQQQNNQQQQQYQNNHHQTATVHATATAAPEMETITSTRTYTTTVLHTTAMPVTETQQDRTVVRTVTKTITEHVRQTEVVTKTRTKTVHATDVVTQTVGGTDNAAVTTTTTANAADSTTTVDAADSTTTTNAADSTTTSDAGIADVNTDVVTVTDVETSTFLVTTTVDGEVATQTATTTFTSVASTSTDIGGNIADVSTTDAASTSTDIGGNIADVSTTDVASSTSTAADSNQTDDPQTSLTLSPRVIESAFAQDGQATPNPGQVPSLTSTNNFINFCLTQPVPLTDGKQIRSGSCNVVPQGFIIAKDRLPSAKFVFPLNFGTIPANQKFTAKLKIKNLQAGAFTNAATNYYAAPAQVNGQGILIGHSHLVIEKINGLGDTEPCDPTKFSFFKGLNLPLDNESTVSATLDNGLPQGTYRMFSINTAANHQPALASIAQHGSMDDAIYFTAA